MSHSRLNLTVKIIAVLIVAGFAASDLQAQSPYCQLQWGMINSDRRIAGQVSAECPLSWHTAGWGNWGVASNVGREQDGNQFQGWKYLDRRYQWNSCTRDHLPGDCNWYNANDCTEQQSATDNNAHGGGYDRLYVSCPVDLDYDGFADVGGCMDITSYSILNNFMSLYEQDWDGDDFVTTLYFPSECCTAEFTCGVYGCGAAASPWFPSAYSTNPETGVSTQILTLIASITFVNDRYTPCGGGL
jgi:hypothetical protein